MDSSLLMTLPEVLVGVPLAFFGTMLVLNIGGLGERMARDTYGRRRLIYDLPPLPPGDLRGDMVRREVRFSRTLGLFFFGLGVALAVALPLILHTWYGSGAGIGNGVRIGF